tara:strand:+ start:874 stop:987 length:114 start_codon:yes stop_codon:yes gene_type:complete
MHRVPGRVTWMALIDISARADMEEQLMRHRLLIGMTK